MKEQDEASRMNFCTQFSDIVDNDEGIFDVLIMSDETHLHLFDYVNKQNFRNLSDINVIQIHEKPPDSEHVIV
jgi:hypothetical protein